MGNLEVGSVDGRVVIEQDVEIDEARTFSERFFATHLRFDGTKNAKELSGGKFGLCYQHGVEEPRLVEIVDGLGFVDAGDFCDANVRGTEQANGFAQVLFAFADIGS